MARRYCDGPQLFTAETEDWSRDHDRPGAEHLGADDLARIRVSDTQPVEDPGKRPIGRSVDPESVADAVVG